MTDARSLVQSVLVPGFDGDTMPDWLARRLEDGLAGVCWFSQNVPDVRRARRLAADLHATREGALVLCDEEGGSVSRIEAAVGSSWPGHAALGRLDDPAVTRSVAAAMGRQVRSAGVDVVLAPVVDVNSDPDNPVIGVRSFGSDPEVVARHGTAFIEGLQSTGLAACAKHYPGHGATHTDSHVDLPRVDAPADVVRARDIAPFAAAVVAGVRCVMTAHVVFTALDEAPATMSRRLLSMLREEMGFEGVIVSDALDMTAISRGVGRGPGAVRALASGVDLLCIGNPSFPESYDAEQVLEEVTSALVTAVDDGFLGVDRVEQAAARVAELGSWVGSHVSALDSAADDLTFGVEVAARIVTSRGDVRLAAAPLVVRVQGPVNVAAGAPPTPLLASLRSRAPSTDAMTVHSVGDAVEVSHRAAGRPVVIELAQRPDPTVEATLAALLSAEPEALVVYNGIPREGEPGARAIHTFGGGRAMAEAAAHLLFGSAR